MPTKQRATPTQHAGQPGEISLRDETRLVATVAVLLAVASLVYCGPRGWLLLYGDAVAHLGIARRIFDSLNPGLNQLGSVWLPLPHLLLAPFVLKTDWWQSGVAGAIPSMASYVFACAGIYRLARRWMRPAIALLVVTAFGLNPGLLYMSVTAMTEPLYLALTIWSVVYLAAFESATRDSDDKAARAALWKMTLVLIAAVFTRYDGWVLGTVAWILAAYWMLRRRWWKSPGNARAFAICTVLLAAAPLAWMGYNWHYMGDPLNFLRGPYSAKAIAERTTKLGSTPYPGWHRLWWALLYSMKSAKMGVAPLRCGSWLLGIAVLGTAYGLFHSRARVVASAVLLWLPVPFYMFSVAYGSLPIFLPVWFPYSYYNTRYGMELIPAFALFPAFAVLAIVRKYPQWRRPVLWFSLALILASNAYLMDATPLVLQEAKVNSTTRVAFEQALANKLIVLPQDSTVLMDTSAHVGALERIGFALRRTINEGDYYQWRAAMQNPAAAAEYVVAIDGDPVAKAVKAHPQNLQLLTVICSTGQPCARIYSSTIAKPRG